MQSRRPLSEETVRMLKGEIQACFNSCHHKPSGSATPARILDIGTEGDSIRLVPWDQLNGTRQVLQYAALSYCWGPSEDAKRQSVTTRQSLHSRMQHIPMSELSPVIKDAVTVTRTLAIPYLWVDSLCIIQGDDVDWQEQARKLGDIYSNAYVTLCILKSISCQVPFLPYLTTHAPEWYKPGDTKPGTASLLLDLIQDMQKSSWAQRGWTFQEEKLCARAVYFGSSGVHFECGNWVYSEGRRGRRGIYENALLDMQNEADGPSGLELFWRAQLVPQIMRRSFTVLSDRLPSLSGIARIIGEKRGSKYAAGLWEDSLGIELPWQCVAQHQTLKSLAKALDPTHEGFVAPSWSWARRANGNASEVFFLIQGKDVDDVSTIAAMTTTTAGDGIDAFGRINSGFLEVSTRVLKLSAEDEMLRQSDGSWTGFNASLFARVTLHLDWVLDRWDPRLCLTVAFVSHRLSRTNGSFRDWFGLVLYRLPDSGRIVRVGVCQCKLTGGTDMDDLSHETIKVF